MSETTPAKTGRELLFDYLFALVWALIAFSYIKKSFLTGELNDIGLMVYYTLISFFFLRRNPLERRCAWWETVVALTAVFLPIAVLRPTGGGPALLGWPVQILGLSGMLLSVRSLGFSFGISPGDRGLVTNGMYRFVRHPLYACQLVFYIGYLLTNPSLRNFAGLLGSLTLMVIRIVREEKIISGYSEYAGSVRWRIVPMVW